jgi:hypothetical protein
MFGQSKMLHGRLALVSLSITYNQMTKLKELDPEKIKIFGKLTD